MPLHHFQPRAAVAQARAGAGPRVLALPVPHAPVELDVPPVPVGLELPYWPPFPGLFPPYHWFVAPVHKLVDLPPPSLMLRLLLTILLIDQTCCLLGWSKIKKIYAYEFKDVKRTKHEILLLRAEQRGSIRRTNKQYNSARLLW